MNIGLIGTGVMGKSISKHLMNKENKMKMYNRT